MRGSCLFLLLWQKLWTLSTWVKSNVYADFLSLKSASVIFIFDLIHVYIKPLLAAAAAPPPQGGVLSHHVEVRRI